MPKGPELVNVAERVTKGMVLKGHLCITRGMQCIKVLVTLIDEYSGKKIMFRRCRAAKLCKFSYDLSFLFFFKLWLNSSI